MFISIYTYTWMLYTLLFMDNRKGCIFWVCEIIQLRCRNKSRPGDTHHITIPNTICMCGLFPRTRTVSCELLIFSFFFFCRHKTTGYTTTTHRYWVLFEKDSQHKYSFLYVGGGECGGCTHSKHILRRINHYFDSSMCRIRLLHLNEIISFGNGLLRRHLVNKCMNCEEDFFQNIKKRKRKDFIYLSTCHFSLTCALIKCFECFKFNVVLFRS